MKKKLDIDWSMIYIPITAVVVISIIFMIYPASSKEYLKNIRMFLSNNFESYYIVIALAFVICTLYLAFSKYGKIKLGKESTTPEYSNIKWGMMIFTSTMSADIIFYSLCEWIMYSQESYMNHIPGGLQKWGLTYSLFHWGPMAWGFYIILSVCFGYMLHVSNRERQRFSEACRPLLGKYTDGIAGKIIDLFAIFALIAGTATTFSMSMPLLSAAINQVTGIPNNKILSVMILLLVALIYTIVAFIGMKGLAKLANISVVLFLTLLMYVFVFSGEQRFIIENGISSIGNLVNNFVNISTDTDPLRKYTFIQNWTVYYWSYWMVWCVATPFFIGKISKGRTIKNVILGGYSWGLAGTYLSFIIMSGYGLNRQFTGKNDFIKMLENGNDYASIIISIFKTIPLSNIGLLLLVLAMVGLYSTVFDSITMVFSAYSYKNLALDQEPDKKIRVFWAIVFIILPIALILTGNSVYNLQSVSIIAALPIGMIMMMIVGSFLKEIKNNHK